MISIAILHLIASTIDLNTLRIWNIEIDEQKVNLLQ